MTLEEKKHLLVKLGLTKEMADYYLEEESDIWAVLPTFRLLKPLSDDLEFYKGGYRNMIEKLWDDGLLEKRMPDVAELLHVGVSPEAVERFAYHLTLQAYEMLLYRMDDHGGAEVDDVFTQDGFSQCPYWKLAEIAPDGTPTGRFLTEVHGKIPFSELS